MNPALTTPQNTVESAKTIAENEVDKTQKLQGQIDALQAQIDAMRTPLKAQGLKI